MRTIAAIPATALLAGAAFGLYVPDPHFLLLYLALSTSVAGAMFGWALHDRVLLVASVSLGFFTGGWLLSSVVWERAWRPPLRVVFEQLAREEREAAAAQGRRMPEDDEAFATVDGVLRVDASLTKSGVSLSVAVEQVSAAPAATPSGSEASAKVSRRGWGPAASEKKLDSILVTAPAATPSESEASAKVLRRGWRGPQRGSRVGVPWGPAASEKNDGESAFISMSPEKPLRCECPRQSRSAAASCEAPADREPPPSAYLHWF